MSDEQHPAFARLVKIMATLRSPNGCPWDKEQTPQTLKPYLVEETYEVLEALEAEDWSEFKEELGDLLLQIVFHSQLMEEAGEFSIDDVAQAIADKMTRRHPHVFGDLKVNNAEEVSQNWAKIKAQERQEKHAKKNKKGLYPFEDLLPCFFLILNIFSCHSVLAPYTFLFNDCDNVIDA